MAEQEAGIIPTKKQIAEYYTSDFIVKQLLENSRSREVAAAFPDGKYDKRPNVLQYPSDVEQMVRRGITSFHLSVERWSNPMGLVSENYESLRTGWDFVIDIDSKLGLEEAKMTTGLITKLLNRYSIKNFGIKFSGRRGFHIVMPWEMFPKEIDYRPLAIRYPEIPRVLAQFIRNKIAKQLLKELLLSRDARQLLDAFEDKENINPFQLVEVEKDWGNRHMFRAPYSINEKTWLVSLPIKDLDLEHFRKEDATIERAVEQRTDKFFRGEENEAADLLTEAIDWYSTIKKEEKPKKPVVKWDHRIPEENFPPCIKLVLEGMEDGKKRSIFTLMNFLRMMNWSPEEIELRILEWNQKNRPMLPMSTVLGQLRYHERRETVPPANCDNSMYYGDVGICRPDGICKRGADRITIKNPINYPFRKMKPMRKEKERQEKEKERQEKGKDSKKVRGFSCGVCNQECDTIRALKMHMGRNH